MTCFVPRLQSPLVDVFQSVHQRLPGTAADGSQIGS
jgi:hypothetical protein